MIVFISILFCLLLLFILWLLLICPAEPKPEQLAPFLGHAFAHRGLHGQTDDAPENSLSAFCLAAAYGYGIELDLALSRDKQVVVFHDDTLKRMCGVDARLDSYDLAALKALRLKGSEETIPLFSEVLETVAGQVPLIIEFKHTGDDSTLVQKALELLASYEGPYCVESFDPRILRRIRRARPDLVRGQLACHLSRKEYGFKAFLLQNLLCNSISGPHFIAYEHTQMKNFSYRAAVKWLHAVPVAWTVRTEQDFYALFDSGVDIQIFEGFLPPAILLEEDTAGPQSEPDHQDEEQETL